MQQGVDEADAGVKVVEEVVFELDIERTGGVEVVFCFQALGEDRTALPGDQLGVGPARLLGALVL